MLAQEIFAFSYGGLTSIYIRLATMLADVLGDDQLTALRDRFYRKMCTNGHEGDRRIQERVSDRLCGHELIYVPTTLSLHEEIDLVKVGNALFEKAFKNGPFTSFKMLDAIVKHMKLDYQDVVNDQKTLKKFDPRDVTAHTMVIPPFSET
ncbi:hypothetical protein GGR54DRAFT_611761 [Hypoxylon sp. NC1633]|nr:hypothetical protein GGR54DRAFT_611761 [Hypoxylon sp. NC1633]